MSSNKELLQYGIFIDQKNNDSNYLYKLNVETIIVVQEISLNNAINISFENI